MERWALVSGLRGDLDLYEQIQADIKKQRGAAHLFVLGDMISPERNCDALLTRLRQPQAQRSAAQLHLWMVGRATIGRLRLPR